MIILFTKIYSLHKHIPVKCIFLFSDVVVQSLLLDQKETIFNVGNFVHGDFNTASCI